MSKCAWFVISVILIGVLEVNKRKCVESGAKQWVISEDGDRRLSKGNALPICIQAEDGGGSLSKRKSLRIRDKQAEGYHQGHQ